MNELQTNRNTADVVAALPARGLPPFLQLAQSRGYRKTHIALPAVPRRPLCPANRPVLAALRQAELAAWLASGGDFLSSLHQPIALTQNKTYARSRS